jgi:ligand-binding sensor domain-containing protein/serine phosphatase RsbU (regulator of sigma subunit)
MRLKLLNKLLLISSGFLFLISSLTKAQTYSFINYGAEKNIPSGFVYTIIQSADGFLWVGTAEGITRFDGNNFFTVQYPDSSAGRFPTKSLKDKNGTLWFGCSDGSIFYSKDNKLIKVPLSNNRSISELLEGPDGLIYALPQGEHIFAIDPSDPAKIHTYKAPLESVLFSGSFIGSGSLLIGTQENLLLCRIEKDSLEVKKVIDGFDSYAVTAIHKTGDGLFIIGTDENGIFRLTISDKGEELIRLENPAFESLKVQSITVDSEKSVWVTTTGSGVLQFDLPDGTEKIPVVNTYDLNSGLAGNNVRTLFQDIQGNYWFGLYGEGISMLANSSLSYYSPGKNPVENNIIYINNFNSDYLLGTSTGFHIFDPSRGKSLSFTDLSAQVGRAEIKSYFFDQSLNLWIGTGGNGLFVRDKNGSVKKVFRSGDFGEDDIRDIQMDNENIWLATTNGVVVLDKKGNFVMKFGITNGLPHNGINKILLTPDGAYIGTETDKLFRIGKDFKISSIDESMSGATRNKILSFSGAADGSVWVATDGNGIFRFRNDSITAISHSVELLSNYCYSILADADGDIWVGHTKGFSRYSPESGNVNFLGTEFPKAGKCNPEGIFESADRKIFIGTTEGLMIYDRGKDRQVSVAPFTNINSIEINDISYPLQASYVLPYTKYKVRIKYSGINFNAPDKVYYSSYLENFDKDWSNMTPSREVLYSLADGKYKFNVVSINRDGLQSAPVSFSILIKKPFYRTWWFILSVIAVLAGIVYLIIREREKSQKAIQAYLETELEARTRVVMKQKAEIELQNLEITDSINYAKRIQTSILPDISKLRETFKDAFILFHPRDIVSGDYYWFDKLGEDKFVLVCADSTGHGVPGAFMSMIGSTLLQDIVTRKKISKPSQILGLLDRQIFSTLNQNAELEVSNDGMDMVVCEFDINSRKIRFASAMRPVILVIDGESFYIKGNRSSVGGESVNEKYFDDQEYYLKEGDTIYLFSDGLPDQFGGKDGKKLKIARLKKFIEQISMMPMEEQKEAMEKFFLDWKGTYDQVDDVLLMGVKV